MTESLKLKIEFVDINDERIANVRNISELFNMNIIRQ